VVQLNGGADKATLSLEGESRSKQEEKKKRREYRAVVTRTSPHFSSSRGQGIHLGWNSDPGFLHLFHGTAFKIRRELCPLLGQIPDGHHTEKIEN
jgi:hypothetical protein